MNCWAIEGKGGKRATTSFVNRPRALPTKQDIRHHLRREQCAPAAVRDGQRQYAPERLAQKVNWPPRRRRLHLCPHQTAHAVHQLLKGRAVRGRHAERAQVEGAGEGRELAVGREPRAVNACNNMKRRALLRVAVCEGLLRWRRGNADRSRARRMQPGGGLPAAIDACINEIMSKPALPTFKACNRSTRRKIDYRRYWWHKARTIREAAAKHALHGIFRAMSERYCLQRCVAHQGGRT